MVMLKEHKEKINTAIKKCETTFSKFSDILDKQYDKSTASKRKQFILENTVFAGGVFRSIFTDTPVNDIDVFFTTDAAAVEFKDMFMSDQKVFATHNITPNETFILNLAKEPSLAFITHYADAPDRLINRFDYSFNKHYFDLNSYSMLFDLDTFSKKGRLAGPVVDPVSGFLRAMRFMNEGFKIELNSLNPLIDSMVNMDRQSRIAFGLNMETSDGQSMINKFPVHLTGAYYTDEDYFNRNSKAGKATKVTITEGQTFVAAGEDRAERYYDVNAARQRQEWIVAQHPARYNNPAPVVDNYQQTAQTLAETYWRQRNNPMEGFGGGGGGAPVRADLTEAAIETYLGITRPTLNTFAQVEPPVLPEPPTENFDEEWFDEDEDIA